MTLKDLFNIGVAIKSNDFPHIINYDTNEYIGEFFYYVHSYERFEEYYDWKVVDVRHKEYKNEYNETIMKTEICIKENK